MLTQWGLKPHLHWLDNEASKALKSFIDEQQATYQLTPPHAAEHAICMFKNHFISHPPTKLCDMHVQEPFHQSFVLGRQKLSPTSMVPST